MDDDLDDYKLETTWHKNPNHVVHVSFDRDHRRAGPGVKKLDRWYRQKELGVGSCGIVHLETRGDGGRERAVKSIRKSMAQRLKIDYRRELAAIATFSRAKYQQHQVFVEFHGWFENSQFIYLAMEYLPLGDLSKHISEGIKERDIKDITSQILEGLQLMHAKGFAHRDLKPQPSWWIKIGDFGIAKRVKDCDATELRTTTGTQGYEAPEIRGYVECDEANPSSVYTKVVDIWSLGCVIYKVVTSRVPFQSGREIMKFCDGKGPFPSEPLLEKLSTSGVEFLRSVLVATPNIRPTANVALQHPWLTCAEEHVDPVRQMVSSPKNENSHPGRAYNIEITNKGGPQPFGDVSYRTDNNIQTSKSPQVVLKSLITPEKPSQHPEIGAGSSDETKKSINVGIDYTFKRDSVPRSYPEEFIGGNETYRDQNSPIFESEKGSKGMTPQVFTSVLQTQPSLSQRSMTSRDPVTARTKTTTSPSGHEQGVSMSNSARQVKNKELGLAEDFLKNVRKSSSDNPTDRYTARTRSQESVSISNSNAFLTAESYRNLGDSAMHRKDYPAAIGAYTLALQRAPGNAILLSNRSAAYLALNYLPFAEDDAIAAVESRPGYSVGWARLGYTRNKLGDMVGSQHAYHQAVTSGGRSDTIRVGLQAINKYLAQEDLRRGGSSGPNPIPIIAEEELDHRRLSTEEPAEAKPKSDLKKDLLRRDTYVNTNEGHITREIEEKREGSRSHSFTDFAKKLSRKNRSPRD